jgi:hypothetical protein
VTSVESQATPSTVSDIVEDDEEAGRSPLAAVDFRSKSAAVACSSSRSRWAACTRHCAAAALASAVSASLTRASSRCRRASMSGSGTMARSEAAAPTGGCGG